MKKITEEVKKMIVKDFNVKDFYQWLSSDQFRPYSLNNHPEIKRLLDIPEYYTSECFICKQRKIIDPKQSELVPKIQKFQKLLYDQRGELLSLKFPITEDSEYLLEVECHENTLGDPFEKPKEELKKYYSLHLTQKYLSEIRLVYQAYYAVWSKENMKKIEADQMDYSFDFISNERTFIQDDSGNLEIFGRYGKNKQTRLMIGNELTMIDQSTKDYFYQSNPFVKEVLEEQAHLPIKWSDVFDAKNKVDLLHTKYRRGSFSKWMNRYPLKTSYGLMKIKSKVTNRQFRKIESFIQKHPEIDVFPTEMFMYARKNKDFSINLLFECMRCMLSVSEEYEVFLEDFIRLGVLNNVKLEFNFRTPNGLIEYHDRLVKVMMKRKAKSLIDFALSINPKFNSLKQAINKNKFYELIETNKQLYLEGLEMDHCVYSYLEKIQNGTCIILKYKKDKERLTIEVEKRPYSNYEVVQCYGKHDLPPDPKVHEEIKSYIAQLPYRKAQFVRS